MEEVGNLNSDFDAKRDAPQCSAICIFKPSSGSHSYRDISQSEVP